MQASRGRPVSLMCFQVGGVEGPFGTSTKNISRARLGDSHGKCKKLARRKGFEPLTPRFEVWCSIQLSYRRLGRKLACCPRAANRRIHAVFAPPQFPPSSGRERWLSKAVAKEITCRGRARYAGGRAARCKQVGKSVPSLRLTHLFESMANPPWV